MKLLCRKKRRSLMYRRDGRMNNACRTNKTAYRYTRRTARRVDLPRYESFVRDTRRGQEAVPSMRRYTPENRHSEFQCECSPHFRPDDDVDGLHVHDHAYRL